MRQPSAERQLIGRMQAGDSSAVAELASTYGPRIQQLAFRYVKNWEDAEEVTQDVLMKVFRKIDAFRGDAALSSWIYRITFNTAMSRLRTGRAARMTEMQQVETTGGSENAGERAGGSVEEEGDGRQTKRPHGLRSQLAGNVERGCDPRGGDRHEAGSEGTQDRGSSDARGGVAP